MSEPTELHPVGKTMTPLNARAVKWLHEMAATRLKRPTDSERVAELVLAAIRAQEIIAEYVAWTTGFEREHELLTKKVLLLRDAYTPNKTTTHWSPAHEIFMQHREKFRIALEELVAHVTPTAP